MQCSKKNARKPLILKRRHKSGDIGGDGGDTMKNAIEINNIEAETESGGDVCVCVSKTQRVARGDSSLDARRPASLHSVGEVSYGA